MTDESRWDQDPPPDESLARRLRAGAPMGTVDWEALCMRVMRRATGDAGRGRDWLEVVAQWGRVAMAASLAAMLVSGFLLWRALDGVAEPEVVAVVPESVAVARAASAFPDETAFASLVRTEHHDEFTTWGIR